ncbi:MAG: ester cyclase [Gammaproteobacteria bacterium]|nr:ester cyclase [Gammaproteobacteria bacterium]
MTIASGGGQEHGRRDFGICCRSNGSVLVVLSDRPGLDADPSVFRAWPSGQSIDQNGRQAVSAEYNLDLIKRLYVALNAQDLAGQDAFWHEDMIWHGPPGFGDVHGLDGFRYKVLLPFYTAFPDYHVKDEIQVANDSWVSATGVLTAHHRGEWLGVPPTGKKITMRYSDFWLVRDGKLSENWVMVDNLGVLAQMGVETILDKRRQDS